MVIALTAQNSVIAIATINGIVTTTAKDGIITAKGCDDVRTIAAINRVGAIAGNNGVIAITGIDDGTDIGRRKPGGGNHGRVARTIRQGIKAAGASRAHPAGVVKNQAVTIAAKNPK